MCKSEIFDTVLSAVAKETEIPIEKIVGRGKSAEVVDARYLAVYILYRKGFYPSMIARDMHMTKQGVSYALKNFQTRRNQSGKIFEINFQRIVKILSNN